MPAKDRTVSDLKARLGLGGRRPVPDADASESESGSEPQKPGPTNEDMAALVVAIVMTALEEYRPWIKAADAAVPEVAAMLTEAADVVLHGIVCLEETTSKYNLELMRVRAQDRKRQFDLYLEAGFSREEALQLLVAGFTKDTSLADRIVKSLGDGGLKAIEKRVKHT